MRLRRPRGIEQDARPGADVSLAAMHRAVLAHARPLWPLQHPMTAASIHRIVNADTGEEALERLAEVVEASGRRRRRSSSCSRSMRRAAAFHSLPREHCLKVGSTNPLERVKRNLGRSDVVGIKPATDLVVVAVRARLLRRLGGQNEAYGVVREGAALDQPFRPLSRSEVSRRADQRPGTRYPTRARHLASLRGDTPLFHAHFRRISVPEARKGERCYHNLDNC